MSMGLSKEYELSLNEWLANHPPISKEEYNRKYGTADRDIIEIEVDGHILQPDDVDNNRKVFEWYN